MIILHTLSHAFTGALALYCLYVAVDRLGPAAFAKGVVNDTREALGFLMEVLEF